MGEKHITMTRGLRLRDILVFIVTSKKYLNETELISETFHIYTQVSKREHWMKGSKLQ
jgi:hypothetical protein